MHLQVSAHTAAGLFNKNIAVLIEYSQFFFLLTLLVLWCKHRLQTCWDEWKNQPVIRTKRQQEKDTMDVNRMHREKALFLGVVVIKRKNTYIAPPWTVTHKSLSPYFSGNSSNLPSPKSPRYNIPILNQKESVQMHLLFKNCKHSGMIYIQ